MPDNNKTDQKEFEEITPEKSEVITKTENVKNKKLQDNSTDQTNDNNQQKRTDGDKEREERKNPNNPTFQYAKWTQKELNEAFDENEPHRWQWQENYSQ